MKEYKNNKIEVIAGSSVVNDNILAVEILKSEAFKAINIVEYLSKLQDESGHDFKKLIELTSSSPFFMEGDRHSEIKKIFARVLGKNSINFWQIKFEQQVEFITRNFKQFAEPDLVNYCFEIAKVLLRPLIFGTAIDLPNDFERRLYKFQKIAEPLLSIRELVVLENEIEYLLDAVKSGLNKSTECLPNSLLNYLNEDSTTELSYDEKIMLLIIIYGAKTPMIQTLANTFLDIMVTHSQRYFTDGVFDETYFLKQLDQQLKNSASLLHIHRVAVKDFTYGDFKAKKGDFALIRIANNAEYKCNRHKDLSFGFKTHFCSGALISRSIISIAIPSFFKIYPNTTVNTWEYDPHIHTARALTKLKVNIE